ncbi:MAG: FlgD immunoglobulin-like domain containing protein, partial [Candidatus Eisenbacteria bacterium]
SYVPSTAEQVQMAMGVVHYCDPWDGCSYVCNATPYFDNATFATFGSSVAPYISMRELDYWQDQFAEDGTLNPTSTADTRTPNYLSNLSPPIFGDTLVCRGNADNMEVYFVFRMAKVGPEQAESSPFFTTWFPGVTGGAWQAVRMDTAEVTSTSGITTSAVPGVWMCAFHEEDPVRVANALPECKEILPNNLFVPGTRIEYFLKSRYAGSPDWFLWPDTVGGRCEEFEVLPMMRGDGGGWIEWPCLIVADHFGQRGNGFERNSDRIARQLRALGIEFDVYSRLGPANDLRNGIGRWAANAGQLGGPGTDKYNWGSGATLTQFLGYKYCIMNTGSQYGYCIYAQDQDMIQKWLIDDSRSDSQRFFWLSGDRVAQELNRRTTWGRPFLNNVLCATYLYSSYASTRSDYTYCLPMRGLAGGRIVCGDPETYVAKENGCLRILNVVGVSGTVGCNGAAEIEYNPGFDGAVDIAAVSNAVSTFDNCEAKYYKTFLEGYDFCLARTDASQGPLACGSDDFLGEWLSSVLYWGGYSPSAWCGPPPDIFMPYPPNCTAEWQNLVCDGDKVFVSPGCSPFAEGDTCFASWLRIVVRDQFNQPMPDIAVDVCFESQCKVGLCAYATDTTSSNGEIFLSIEAGVDVSGGTGCCQVTAKAFSYGIQLYEGTMEWLSADMNADSLVNEADSSMFYDDWLTSACRSDFNCDGIVNDLDWMVFAPNFGRGCSGSVVSAGEREPGPVVTSLAQSYPNPSARGASIAFSVSEPGHVLLRIYDIAGRPVRTLVEGHREAQRYEVVWDGRDDEGRQVRPGVYFYEFEAPGYRETKKLVLLR